MKNLLLFCFLFFCTLTLVFSQESLKVVTKQLPNGTFEFVEKNARGDTLVIGLLSSVNPFVRNGEFTFYNSNRIIEARGKYTSNIPTGIWSYYDKSGNITKAVNYDKTVEFLNADTIKLKVVYMVVEQMPYFEDGDPNTFREYLEENMVYPIYAAKNNISDRVFVQYNVTKKGKVCNLRILRSIGDTDLNMEALRLISESPLWHPGLKRNNDTVDVSYTFPVTFFIK